MTNIDLVIEKSKQTKNAKIYTYYLLTNRLKPLFNLYQSGDQIEKFFVRFARRSEVQIPGRGKCSLRTISVDARVNQ